MDNSLQNIMCAAMTESQGDQRKRRISSDTEIVHIGAEAKLYTAEYNLATPIDSLEDVIKAGLL